MKKLVIFLCSIIFTLAVLTSSACGGKDKNELERTGYVYDELVGAYVKEDSETCTKTINFSLTDEVIGSFLIIPSNIDHFILEGKAFVQYKSFYLLISPRENDLTVEFLNFSFTSRKGKPAIDASELSNDVNLKIMVTGVSKIIGGAGSSGANGKSYSISTGVKSPKNGEDGENGDDGNPAIIAKKLEIAVISNGSLTMIGGNGAKGGNGGNGQGSASEGRGQAGFGGDGGNGGNGACAIYVEDSLKIDCLGKLTCQGGDGGNGGDGGEGGKNTDTGVFDIADHGGDGGSGGAGGNGASAIEGAFGDAETINNLICIGGNGGNGGAGGDGGVSCRNEFEDRDRLGGVPGAAGGGGDGGDGAVPLHNSFTVENLLWKGGNGGSGGKAGSPGYSSVYGYGSYASDGTDGNDGIYNILEG